MGPCQGELDRSDDLPSPGQLHQGSLFMVHILFLLITDTKVVSIREYVLAPTEDINPDQHCHNTRPY